MTFSSDERAARRTVRLLVVAVFVALVGATVSVAVRLVRDEPPGGSSARSSSRSASSGTPRPDDQGIGPLPGAVIADYLGDRRIALERLTGETIAVVSLTRYATEAEVRAGVAPLTVVALLAAPPGDTPSVVTTSLTQWADERREAQRTERDEISRLIPTTDDPDFKVFYEQEVVRLDKAITALDPAGPVLFGVVLRGSADELRALSLKPGVRMVDVAAPDQVTETLEYRGLRPEETDKAGEPPTRPV